MFTRPNKIQINRSLENFHGNKLVVGCGWNESHNSGHDTELIHPKDEYYTIDIDKNTNPDMVADFSKTIDHAFFSRKFQLIILESYNGNLTADLFKNLFTLLDSNGICIIDWTAMHMVNYNSNNFEYMLRAGFEKIILGEDTRSKNVVVPIFILAKDPNLLHQGNHLQGIYNLPITKIFKFNNSKDKVPLFLHEAAEKYNELKFAQFHKFIEFLEDIIKRSPETPSILKLKVIQDQLLTNKLDSFAYVQLEKIALILYKNGNREDSEQVQRMLNQFNKQMIHIDEYRPAIPTTKFYYRKNN